jgi:hypothetical protein
MDSSQADIIFDIGDPDNPVLNGFMADDADYAIIRGPLGSGKTTGSICKLQRHMREQPANSEGVRPSRFLAVRNTYLDLAGTTIKDFKAQFGRMSVFKGGGNEPPNSKVGFWMPDGTRVQSEVIFLALDREDAVKKLRGYQLTGVWANEVKELIKPIIVMARGRCGRYPNIDDGGVRCGWYGLWGDTNSWDEDHWLHQLMLDDEEGWEFFHQPGGVEQDGLRPDGRKSWKLNPTAENLKGLPVDYYRKLILGAEQDWIEVNAANEYGFTVGGCPVWREYVDPVHCPEAAIEYEERLPIILGIDFGRTPAAAFIQFDPVIGRFCVFDEFVATSMSASVFGPALYRYLRANYPKAAVRGWGDPAGDAAGQTVETTPIQMITGAGVPCAASPVPGNNMLVRRTAVIGPLTRMALDGRPALLISKKCKMLRKAAKGGFCFRQLQLAGEDRYTETPDKNQYSHIAEALEYGLAGEGEGINALYPPPMPGDYQQEFAEM